MVIHEDRCVGCPPERGCLGDACPNKNVAVYICDHCEEDIEGVVYEVDGEDLCEYCLHQRFRKDYY